MADEPKKRPTLKKEADGTDNTQQNDVKDTNIAPETGKTETDGEKAPGTAENSAAAASGDAPAPAGAGNTQDPATPPVAAASMTPPAQSFAPPPVPQNTPLPTHIDQGVSFDQFVKKMASIDAALVEKIDVVAERAYKLTLDNGFVVQMIKGVQSVHRFIAEHPYSQANGLKPYDRGQGVEPAVPNNAFAYASSEITAGRKTVESAIKDMAGFYKVEEAKVKAAFDKYLSTLK